MRFIIILPYTVSKQSCFNKVSCSFQNDLLAGQETKKCFIVSTYPQQSHKVLCLTPHFMYPIVTNSYMVTPQIKNLYCFIHLFYRITSGRSDKTSNK